MGRIITTVVVVLASIVWPAPAANDMYEETELAYQLFETYFDADLRFVRINWQKDCFASDGDQVGGYFHQDGSDRNCVDRDYGIRTLIHELAHAFDYHYLTEWSRKNWMEAKCEVEVWHNPDDPYGDRCVERFAIWATELLMGAAESTAAITASGEVLAPSQGAHASSGAPPQAATLAGPYSALRFPVNPSFVGVSLATLGDGQCSAL